MARRLRRVKDVVLRARRRRSLELARGGSADLWTRVFFDQQGRLTVAQVKRLP